MRIANRRSAQGGCSGIVGIPVGDQRCGTGRAPPSPDIPEMSRYGHTGAVDDTPMKTGKSDSHEGFSARSSVIHVTLLSARYRADTSGFRHVYLAEGAW
jgi:hypothetical protein